MIHPLIDNMDKVKDNDLENKITSLTNKYFMTNNSSLKQQIVSMLECYKEELAIRHQKALNNITEKKLKDIDKLINIK